MWKENLAKRTLRVSRGKELALKAVLIVGLPGSGKTTLAKTKYVPQGYTLIDDPVNLLSVEEVLTEKVVITDPYFVLTDAREAAKKFFEEKGYEVEFIYFANEIATAEKNCLSREDDRGEINVRMFSKFYTIPPNQDIIPCFAG